MDYDQHQPNELAAIVIAESLANLGVREAIISPGSRSTPLTVAFAEHPLIRTSVMLDERSAAFFALGKSKKKQTPTVLLCTSGTAAANYLPAIVEAYHTQTPLIVLTADRPPQLQSCGVGQTIKQAGIYGGFVSWEHSLAIPRSDYDYLCYLRETIKQSYRASMGAIRGVSHINIAFEEPLVPKHFGNEYTSLRTTLAEALQLDQVALFARNQKHSVCFGELDTSAEKILIVAGPNYASNEDASVHYLVGLCDTLKAPIVCDVLGPWRNVEALKAWSIEGYDGLLRSGKSTKKLQPELVIQIGELPTSKFLRAALEQWKAPTVVVFPGKDRADPTNANLIASVATIMDLQTVVQSGTNSTFQDLFLKQWKQSARCVAEKLNQQKNQNSKDLSEFSVCSNLAQWITHPVDLYIGNSVMIRDMEQLRRGNDLVKHVFSNRGANGIDGQVSTAMGCASDSRPMIALTGDLTFLHDAGGLAAGSQVGKDVKCLFIVFDNAGGGIFEHLPIAKNTEVFEPFFATKQSVDLEALAKAYHLNYSAPNSVEDLRQTVVKFLQLDPQGTLIQLIHLKFDRKQAYELRKSIVRQIDKALEEDL